MNGVRANVNNDLLLAAVLAKPEADFYRLLYAEWLEEHGDGVRAEFIRAQCWLAKNGRHTGPPKVCTCEKCEVQKREELCWREGRAYWGPRSLLSADAVNELRMWKRGFIFMASCTCAQWLDYGDEVIQECPIEWVFITDKWPDFAVNSGVRYLWHNEAAFDVPEPYRAKYAGVQIPTDASLPPEIFSFLSDGSVAWPSQVYKAWFDPVTDLFQACLKYARWKLEQQKTGASA